MERSDSSLADLLDNLVLTFIMQDNLALFFFFYIFFSSS